MADNSMYDKQKVKSLIANQGYDAAKSYIKASGGNPSSSSSSDHYWGGQSDYSKYGQGTNSAGTTVGAIVGAIPASQSGKSGSSSGKSSGSSGSSGTNITSYLDALRARQQADAEAAYANARNALNSAYDSASEAFGNIYNSGVDQLGRSYDNSRGKINSEATDAFRQAYINRMLSEKNLGQRLAAMGMSGGASESTMAGLINNYGNARNGIQRTLDTNLGDLEMTYQGNLADLYNAYQQNMANIASQRATQLANLETQLANLNANMGGDYLSMLMSNAGALKGVMSDAVANQNAYQAPNEQTVTNTFNPANTTQANDMGSTATNWWRDYVERLRAAGANDLSISQILIDRGLKDADIVDYMYR